MSGTQLATSKPAALTVTMSGMGLTLAWTNNSPNASGFKVERKDGATGLYAQIATLPKTPTGIFTTAYADVGVQPGVTYTYQVRGYSDAGRFTAYSDPVSGTRWRPRSRLR